MKALFFLRHYNDIDHITPVITKWSESGHSADVVLLGSSKFLTDYRIRFLGTLNQIRVTHLYKILLPHDFLLWRLQVFLLSKGARRVFLLGRLAERLAEKYDADKRAVIWQKTARRLLDRIFGNTSEGVVIFDWIRKGSPISIEWVETIVSMAKERGYGAVSLPHGDSPHANQLIRHHEWVVKPDTMYADAKIFDKVVVPNELCATRFRPFLDEKAIAVLGSPRYCDEWLERLAKLSPASGHPIRPDTRLKIALFLRKSEFTTFWEEVGEVAHLIAAFPGVELIIKPHTRGGWRQPFTRSASLRKLPNVSVAADNVHSIPLMNWADIIIDLATSVVFEAIKAKKPVLAADYLHAGRSTMAHYMPETELKCRDDVYLQIKKFLSEGCDNFYVEENRQRFIDEMLHAGGPDVLPRYVTLLENEGRQARIRKTNNPNETTAHNKSEHMGMG